MTMFIANSRKKLTFKFKKVRKTPCNCKFNADFKYFYLFNLYDRILVEI